MNNIFHSIKVNLHDSISTKNLNLLGAFTIHLHSKQHLGGLKNFWMCVVSKCMILKICYNLHVTYKNAICENYVKLSQKKKDISIMM